MFKFHNWLSHTIYVFICVQAVLAFGKNFHEIDDLRKELTELRDSLKGSADKMNKITDKNLSLTTKLEKLVEVII